MAGGDFLAYAEMDAVLRSLVVTEEKCGRMGTVTWPSGREEKVHVHYGGRLSMLTPEPMNGCKVMAWITSAFDDPACLYVRVTQPNGVTYGGMNSSTKGVRTTYNLENDLQDTREEDLSRCTDW